MDREFIERVRESVDIVDVIGQYVELKRSGRSYKGLCPFHREKTPSFYVDPEKGVYHCFGCGASGNVFRFIMEMEKVEFIEAVKILAQKAGIPIPETRSRRKYEPLYKALEFAADFYHRLLFSETGRTGLNFLLGRKIERDMINLFNLGFAPPHGKMLLKRAKESGFSEEVLVQAGLITKGSDGAYHDLLRNRVVFPIYNFSGSVVGFGGRALEKTSGPKYLNSPDTKLFKKGELLYGYYQTKRKIREEGSVFLVEGYIDLIMMYQAGLQNAVAPLGTAFTEGQARILGRAAKRVTLVYDGDEAGFRAAYRSVPLLLAQGVMPRVAVMPKGEDPASLVEKGQVDLLREVLLNAPDFLSFLLSRRKWETPEELTSVVREMIDILSNIDDGVALGVYLKLLSEKTGLSQDFLRIELMKRRGREVSLRKKSAASRRASSSEMKLLGYAFIYDSVREKIKRDLEAELFRDPMARLLVEKIKMGQSPDEILSEGEEGLREVLSRVLLEIEGSETLEELLLFRLDMIRLKGELERHKTALREAERSGKSDEAEEHLRRIQEISRLLQEGTKKEG